MAAGAGVTMATVVGRADTVVVGLAGLMAATVVLLGPGLAIAGVATGVVLMAFSGGGTAVVAGAVDARE